MSTPRILLAKLRQPDGGTKRHCHKPKTCFGTTQTPPSSAAMKECLALEIETITDSEALAACREEQPRPSVRATSVAASLDLLEGSPEMEVTLQDRLS
ncbi:hypothetical protein [Piscinibacterium candidicorallinum]|uniref:Uncharacterized protein n=1 Tax=Piscinibacterium candidicorallinum TaxID=1793872 RepID=A0ABV7H2J6_9BURK